MAEGRWTTWSDETDAPHIARLDVPGNEGLEADYRAGSPRRPTREELQRAIDWTAAHPEWLNEVHREFEEEFGIPFEVPPETPPAPGPFWYLDSRTGAIAQATRAADLGGEGPRGWWRLVLRSDDSDSGNAVAEAEVQRSLDSGEPAITVSSDFPFRAPMEQHDLAREAIDQLYREPTTGDPGGTFWPQILDLQRQWGVSPPVPSPETGGEFPVLPGRRPAFRDGARSEGEPPVSLRRVGTNGGESVEGNFLDMMERADRGIPSQREGDIGVPGHRLRQFSPLPPSQTPQVPPGRLERGLPRLGSSATTIAALPSMDLGGIVPTSGPYTLHAGEAVLPTAAVSKIAQGASGALASDGFLQWLRGGAAPGQLLVHTSPISPSTGYSGMALPTPGPKPVTTPMGGPTWVRQPPPLHQGGIVPATGAYSLQAGEAVLPATVAQGASSPPATLAPVHPFNQGVWPTEDEQARRLREIIEQLERMKRENPSLYRRLPLLHELLPPPVPTPEILRDRPSLVPAPDLRMGENPGSIASTLGPRVWDWLRSRTVGEPGSLMLGEMPLGPGGLARRVPPAPVTRMSLKRALETLGVPIESPVKGRTVRGSATGIGLARPSSLYQPVTERIPGGPDYLYETAREAYRARARALHPDRAGSTEAMQRLNEAWEVVERYVKYHPR